MVGRFRFADFELDPGAYTLTRAGRRIDLEKVPMEVLQLLVDRAGLLVDRAEIHRRIWGVDVFIDRDAAINTAVRKIRDALDDDADSPRFIETVVGKGYRFIAPLEPAVVPATGSGLFRALVMRRGTEEFSLKPGENLLGRDPQSQIYVDHPSVSRRHARVWANGDSVMLEDLASRNGTFVDGRKIESPVELRHGAIVGVGAVALTFLVVVAPESTQPLGGIELSSADQSQA